jgi:TrmH family RNA methyltransferase
VATLSASKRRLIQRVRNPRLRDKEGLFLVEGIRVTQELLQASLPFRVRFSLVSSRLAETAAGAALQARLEAAPIPTEEIADDELREVSDTQSSQGVLLVLEEPPLPLSPLRPDASERVLLLDALRDPGNAGTLVRVAWAFGMTRVVFLEGSVDPWSPKVVRAAAGASFHVPVCRAMWAETEIQLRTAGIPVFVADPGGQDVREAPRKRAWALAVGNEADGVRPGLREACSGALAVPMAATVDSLNAGVAGAILIFSLSSPESREKDD